MRKLKININKISKKFGDKVVLNKLDLKVFESESLAGVEREAYRQQ